MLPRAVIAGRGFPVAMGVQGDPDALETHGSKKQEHDQSRIVRRRVLQSTMSYKTLQGSATQQWGERGERVGSLGQPSRLSPTFEAPV